MFKLNFWNFISKNLVETMYVSVFNENFNYYSITHWFKKELFECCFLYDRLAILKSWKFKFIEPCYPLAYLFNYVLEACPKSCRPSVYISKWPPKGVSWGKFSVFQQLQGKALRAAKTQMCF